MQTLASWLLVPLLIAAAYPSAAWLLALSPRRESRWLTLCLALALSIGALTLVMFWLALLGVSLAVPTITLVYAALMLPGWFIWRRTRRVSQPVRMPKTRVEWLALLAFAGISLAVLFNAAYFPFSRDDAVGIYDAQAQAVVRRGALVPLAGADSLYLTYPALMPLAYAYTYLASGWHNEYLARVIPALLSLGCIPAAFVFGRGASGRLAGWLSALVFALVPTFARWASAGYVDLPAGFFYTLAAIFAWRLWQTRHPADALLAGVTMGLAAWTKNVALIGVAALAGWLLALWLARRVRWQQVALALVGCALVAAPWYARNLAGAGFLIPDTVWSEDARQTLDNLLVFVTRPEIYGLSGWLILIGVVYTLWRILRREDMPLCALLLLWTAPFFAAWFVFASYDPRFLLMILPALSVLAGVWLAAVWHWLPARWQNRLVAPAVVLLLVLAAYSMWIGVEFKDEILRNPLMSDAGKHALVLGDED